jgi:hypothetical protein
MASPALAIAPQWRSPKPIKHGPTPFIPIKHSFRKNRTEMHFAGAECSDQLMQVSGKMAEIKEIDLQLNGIQALKSYRTNLPV